MTEEEEKQSFLLTASSLFAQEGYQYQRFSTAFTVYLTNNGAFHTIKQYVIAIATLNR